MPPSDRKAIYQRVGFTENPFAVAADPRFHYLSAQHRVVLDNLQAIVDDHQGLAVVEGAMGVGKSMLARRLHAQYEKERDSYRVLYLHTAAYKTAFEALSDITERLGLPMRRGAHAKRLELERWLLAQHRTGYTVVIIVDDAQMLSPASLEVFHYLYNFDVREKLVQVVLFGQTEIRDLLDANKPLRSRVLAWETLLPMRPADALNMINYRCQVAGHPQPILDESAFMALYEASEGNPRTLVILCQDVVKLLAASGQKVADLAAAEQAIQRFQQRPDGAGGASQQLPLPEAPGDDAAEPTAPRIDRKAPTRTTRKTARKAPVPDALTRQ